MVDIRFKASFDEKGEAIRRMDTSDNIIILKNGRFNPGLMV